MFISTTNNRRLRNTCAFKPRPWVLSIPRWISVHFIVCADAVVARTKLKLDDKHVFWFDVKNGKLLESSEDERHNTRGERDTEKFWCTVVSYQFTLLFYFRFWLLWAVKESWRHSFCSTVFFFFFGWFIGRHCCSKVHMPETVLDREWGTSLNRWSSGTTQYPTRFNLIKRSEYCRYSVIMYFHMTFTRKIDYFS